MRMRLQIAFIFLFGVLLNTTANAQSAARIPSEAFKDYARRIHKNIGLYLQDKKTGLYFETADSIQKENPHSWLWPLCALLQASNEMDVLEPGKKYMEPVVNAIDQYYSPVAPAAYQDYVTAERKSSRFYDDNQWIAIAYLDAYDRTHQAKYLRVSKMIYQFMIKGLDTVAGGGLYWKEGDKSTKNTCSNGPAILVALQLYKVTKEKQYLNTALSVYSWTYAKLLSPGGLFYDAIKLPSLKIDRVIYTYNAGTMLQANALLYKLTNNRKYLLEAQRIATAAKTHFYKDGRLPSNYWFNAVMLRGYLELYAIDENKEWVDFYKQDAERIWKEDRDECQLLGRRKKHRSLIDQAGMLEMYARLALIKN